MTVRAKMIWFLIPACGLAAGLPIPQNVHIVFPSQGSGAQGLTSPTTTTMAATKGPVPKIPFVEPVTNTWYFAATATDKQGLESDYSEEISWSTTNQLPRVTLGWDPSPSTNVIVDYKVYVGPASRTYTNAYSAGANLTLTLNLYPPVPTNFVVQVTSANATNLLWCSGLRQPWHLLGATNWAATNDFTRVFWKAVGRSSRRMPLVYLKAGWQL